VILPSVLAESFLLSTETSALEILRPLSQRHANTPTVFLSFFPKISVILNMDADHLDFFKDSDDIAIPSGNLQSFSLAYDGPTTCILLQPTDTDRTGSSRRRTVPDRTVRTVRTYYVTYVTLPVTSVRYDDDDVPYVPYDRRRRRNVTYVNVT